MQATMASSLISPHHNTPSPAVRDDERIPPVAWQIAVYDAKLVNEVGACLLYHAPDLTDPTKTRSLYLPAKFKDRVDLAKTVLKRRAFMQHLVPLLPANLSSTSLQTPASPSDQNKNPVNRDSIIKVALAAKKAGSWDQLKSSIENESLVFVIGDKNYTLHQSHLAELMETIDALPSPELDVVVSKENIVPEEPTNKDSRWKKLTFYSSIVLAIIGIVATTLLTIPVIKVPLYVITLVSAATGFLFSGIGQGVFNTKQKA